MNKPKASTPIVSSALLGGDWVCSGCGAVAEAHVISRTHADLCATERNFVEVHGQWTGEQMVGGLEGECFGEYGESAKTMVWQICGKCEDIRWSEPPNDSSSDAPNL
jgi:hypothetical protein